jgi:hypothetical protein
MSGWQERAITASSFLICALVVILGTLLYPFILLFFTLVAFVYPLYRRIRRGPPPGQQLPQGGTGR